MKHGTCKILLIDDEEALREEITEELQDAGYCVTVASNGCEGLEQILKMSPDLIICDVNMPKLDGHELLQELRKNRPEFGHIPFLFLSAFNTSDAQLRGLELGADDYLCKPVDFDLMLAKVRSALRVHESFAERMEEKERVDDLTSLPNKGAAVEYLFDCVIDAHNAHGKISVAVAEMDNCRNIVGAMGFDFKSKFLYAVARQLEAVLGEGAHVSYLGDADFLIILSHDQTHDPADDAGFSQDLLDIFQAPLLVECREVFPTVKIGFTRFPRDGADVHALIQNAYSALRSARKLRGNAICRFSNEIADEDAARFEIERCLYTALENDEFKIHYQPISDVKTGRLIGMEALLRWNNEILGSVPPDKFISVAEDLGLIHDIFAWVLNAACRQQIAWQSETGLALKVAVNVSPVQLQRSGFVDGVLEIMQQTGIDAANLALELTENMVVENPEYAQAVLDRLSELGVSLSIDDFGTGYSSLSYLRNLPVDVLKIDREFIKNIGVQEQAGAIVCSIIGLGHALGMTVLAEGVETENQMTFLRHSECDLIQGYYYAKPLSVEGFTRLISIDETCFQDIA